MTQRDLDRTRTRFALQLGALTLAAGIALLCIGGVITPAQVLDHPATWWAGVVAFVLWRRARYLARLERSRLRLERAAQDARRQRAEQEATAQRDTRPAGNVLKFERRRPADVVEFPSGEGRAS